MRVPTHKPLNLRGMTFPCLASVETAHYSAVPRDLFAAAFSPSWVHSSYILLTFESGPSGSGKTTLMNALACRLDGSTSSNAGAMHLNGQSYDSSSLKQVGGYVMQVCTNPRSR